MGWIRIRTWIRNYENSKLNPDPQHCNIHYRYTVYSYNLVLLAAAGLSVGVDAVSFGVDSVSFDDVRVYLLIVFRRLKEHAIGHMASLNLQRRKV